MTEQPEIPIRAIVDSIEAGTPLSVVASACGTTAVGLVVAGIQWLAEHPSEVTNEEHARICSTLAMALGPNPDGVL